MMTALALVGLLTQFGITAYKRMADDLQHAALARELAQALREARNLAVLRQRAVLVTPVKGDWGLGWHTRLELDGQLLGAYRPARQARVIASDARVVRFSARGAPLGTGFGGTTLHVCQRGSTLSLHQVVLSPSGRVSLRSDPQARCTGG